MSIEEFNFTIDTRSDPDLSGPNQTLRSLTRRGVPLEPRHIVGFQVTARPDSRTAVMRITVDQRFQSDYKAPQNGKAFPSTAAPNKVRFVMSNKIAPSSLTFSPVFQTSSNVKYNGSFVEATGTVTVSKDYILEVDLDSAATGVLWSGTPDNPTGVGVHTVELLDLTDIEGRAQERTETLSWSIQETTANIDAGDPEPYTKNLKYGDYRVARIIMDRNANIEEQLALFLSDRGIDRDSVVAQSLVTAHQSNLELYILYFEVLFPRVIETYPNQGAVQPVETPPDKLTFTFSSAVDTGCMMTGAGIQFAGADLLPADYSFSDDSKIMSLDISSGAWTGAETGIHDFCMQYICAPNGRTAPAPPMFLTQNFLEIAGGGTTGAPGGTGAPGAPGADGTGAGTDVFTGMTGDFGDEVISEGLQLLTFATSRGLSTSGDAASDTMTFSFESGEVNVGDLGDVSVPTGIGGSIMYHNDILWVHLPAADSGEFLKTAGSGEAPYWEGIDPSEVPGFQGHTGDTGLHFTTDQISHTEISDVGTNTHGQIDTQLGDLGQTGTDLSGDIVANDADIALLTQTGIDLSGDIVANDADIAALTLSGSQTSGDLVTHTADTTIHFTVGSINLDDLGDVSITGAAGGPTGALLYSDGISWTGLPIGSEDQILRITGGNIMWGAETAAAGDGLTGILTPDGSNITIGAARALTFADPSGQMEMTGDDASDSISVAITGVLSPDIGGVGIANAPTSTITLGGPLDTDQSVSISASGPFTGSFQGNFTVNAPATIDVDTGTGAIPYWSQGTLTSIEPGSIGAILRSSGDGSAPYWSGIGASEVPGYESHTGDTGVHFTTDQISHLEINDIGTNTHAQIDTQLTALIATGVTNSGAIVANDADIEALSVSGSVISGGLDTHTSDATIHFTAASISLDDLGDVNAPSSADDTGEILYHDGTEWVTLARQNSGSDDIAVIRINQDNLPEWSEVRLTELSDITFDSGLPQGTLMHVGSQPGQWSSLSIGSSGNFLHTHGNIPFWSDVLTGDIPGLTGLIDTHQTNTGIHFTTDQITHLEIGDIGTNTHAQIDTQLTALIGTGNDLSGDVAALSVSGSELSGDFVAHTGDLTIHFTEGSIDHTNILNIGTNSHAAIDTQLSDLGVSGTDLSGDILNNASAISDLSISGTTISGALDTHTSDATIHFTEASIDHTNILNIGTKTHAQLDTVTDDLVSSGLELSGDLAAHTGVTTIHFTEASIDHTNITNIGTGTHAQLDQSILDLHDHSGRADLHYTEASIDHGNIAGLGDDDHPEYVPAEGTRPFTGRIFFESGFDVPADGFDVTGDATLSGTLEMGSGNNIELYHGGHINISPSASSIAGPRLSPSLTGTSSVPITFPPVAAADGQIAIQIAALGGLHFRDHTLDLLEDVTAPSNTDSGQLLFYDGFGWVTLESGATDQVLTIDSTGIPSWQSPAGGGSGTGVDVEVAGTLIAGDAQTLDFTGGHWSIDSGGHPNTEAGIGLIDSNFLLTDGSQSMAADINLAGNDVTGVSAIRFENGGVLETGSFQFVHAGGETGMIIETGNIQMHATTGIAGQPSNHVASFTETGLEMSGSSHIFMGYGLSIGNTNQNTLFFSDVANKNIFIQGISAGTFLNMAAGTDNLILGNGQISIDVPLDMTDNIITDLDTGTDPDHAVRKDYVDEHRFSSIIFNQVDALITGYAAQIPFDAQVTGMRARRVGGGASDGFNVIVNGTGLADQFLLASADQWLEYDGVRNFTGMGTGADVGFAVTGLVSSDIEQVSIQLDYLRLS